MDVHTLGYIKHLFFLMEHQDNVHIFKEFPLLLANKHTNSTYKMKMKKLCLSFTWKKKRALEWWSGDGGMMSIQYSNICYAPLPDLQPRALSLHKNATHCLFHFHFK